MTKTFDAAMTALDSLGTNEASAAKFAIMFWRDTFPARNPDDAVSIYANSYAKKAEQYAGYNGPKAQTRSVAYRQIADLLAN